MVFVVLLNDLEVSMSLYGVGIKTKEVGKTDLFAWCHQESNRGHKDFQSFALPTELWHLAVLRLQSYVIFFI